MGESTNNTLRHYYGLDYNKAKPNRFADRLAQEGLIVVIEPEAAAKLPLTNRGTFGRGSEPLASAQGVSFRPTFREENSCEK